MAFEKIVTTILIVIVVICDGRLQIPEEVYMNMPELVSRVGDGAFTSVELVVRTLDGHMLGTHRILPRNRIKSKFPPVLLLHGIVGSSEDYLRMGQNNSLAILLAEAGYDVWLGNIRGNSYSHHLKLSKRDPGYWNFSFDEHGKFDVTATMDQVLLETGAPRIHVVCYSMGCTSLLVACNVRPDLRSKVIAAVTMAPAMGVSGRLKPLAQVVFKFRVPRLLRDAGLEQVNLGLNVQTLLSSTACAIQNSAQNLCIKIANLFIGSDDPQVDWEKTKVIYSRLQPTSLRTITHYGQYLLSSKLTKYDWGKEGNMEKYGHPTPEAYNHSALSFPTHIIYGANDMLVSPDEVIKFAMSLKKTNPKVTIRRVEYAQFNHLDFVFAKDVNHLLNKDVLDVINQYANTENSYINNRLESNY